MQIETIKFDKDEDPATVTVTMSIREAVYLAQVTGNHSEVTASAVVEGGGDLNSSVYSCLVGGVLNRFWDSGLEGAVRQLGMRPRP